MRVLTLLSPVASLAICTACAAQAGGLPPATAPQAIAATQTCADATKPSGVDTEVLAQSGWVFATYTKDNQPVETDIQFWGNSDGTPLLIVGADNKSCLVTGGLQSLNDFKLMVEAFNNELTPAGTKGNSHYFRIGADIAVLRLTGSRRSPTFTVAVLELGEKN